MVQTVAGQEKTTRDGATDYEVIDADGHVIETGENLWPYLEPPYAGDPRLISRITAMLPALDGWNRIAQSIETSQARGAGNYSVANTNPPDWPDWQTWLSFLDENRISRTVLYPSTLLPFGAIRGTSWPVALARAYNTYLHDQFTRHSGRLHGVALIPVQDGEEGAKELERAVRDLAFVGGVLMVSGIRRALGDRMYDPLYAKAEELDVPLTVHAGGTDYLGFDHIFDRGLVEILTVSHGFGQMVQMVSMMMSGVFERFPRLRVGFLEAGVGWAPWVMFRMDRVYEARWPQAPDLKRQPSECIANGNLFFHVEADELSPALYEYLQKTIGRDDIFLYASDFPHEPVREIAQELSELRARTDLPDETKRKVLSEGAKRFYGFP